MLLIFMQKIIPEITRKKYVFNYTIETVRSAYKTTHITNATVSSSKKKKWLE